MQQQCTFESPIKQNFLQSPESARWPVADYLVFYLHSLDLPTPYRLKIANFSHPLLFSALIWGDPYQIDGKALLILKLVFQAVDSEDLVILACTAFYWSTHVTDRQTDRIAMAKMRYRSSCCCTWKQRSGPPYKLYIFTFYFESIIHVRLGPQGRSLVIAAAGFQRHDALPVKALKKLEIWDKTHCEAKWCHKSKWETNLGPSNFVSRIMKRTYIPST